MIHGCPPMKHTVAFILCCLAALHGSVRAENARLVLESDTGITLREGFDAELLYEVPKPQGSYGRLIFRNEKEVAVATNPSDMNQVTKAPANQVEDIQHSQVSLMPSEMISGMNRDELMDLMAYLLSGGGSQHKVCTK
jgi:hypothetical protein